MDIHSLRRTLDLALKAGHAILGVSNIGLASAGHASLRLQKGHFVTEGLLPGPSFGPASLLVGGGLSFQGFYSLARKIRHLRDSWIGDLLPILVLQKHVHGKSSPSR